MRGDELGVILTTASPGASHSTTPASDIVQISLMESEESLEVASVSSTSPQIRHTASAQHCLAFSPFTPWATPILSWSLVIASVSPQRMLPHNPITLSLSAEKQGQRLEEDLSEASLPPFLMATSAKASSHLSDAAEIYVAV
ncbi:hypothetical protein NQZ68_003906 [Dissostichus eleginoides]|nr:hypothetical protein NQZ68_003906 [Dissostichus eleginoides]